LDSLNPLLLLHLPLPLTVALHLLLLLLLLLLLFHQARITKRQRPLWNHKVVQILNFSWEPFEPENP
jgi:hypothetical protein